MNTGNNYTRNQNEGKFFVILPSFYIILHFKLEVNFLILYRIPYFRIQSYVFLK